MGHRRRSGERPTWVGLWAKHPFCWLCGEYVAPLEASLDHLVPTSLGGARFQMVNAALAHRPCNSHRGNDFGPRMAARVYDHLGWKYQPLAFVCPAIFGVLAELY